MRMSLIIMVKISILTEPHNLPKNAGQLWWRSKREVKEIAVSLLSSALIFIQLNES